MTESSQDDAPTPAEAARALDGRVRRTPVLSDPALDAELDARLFLKAEHLQHTGSFKYRGASFAVGRLSDRVTGVATHSSGNHGAALAAAARARGLTADIVMPETAVRTKVDAVRAQGGTVHFCAPTQAAREAGLAELVAQGRVPIPPYDHDDIIAGQGTVAIELLDQVRAMTGDDAPGDLDVVVAPIGGGGLLGGIARALETAAPGVEVIGAEPVGADDAARSRAAGRRVEDHHPQTIADGLRALVGTRNLAILEARDIRILTVSEDAIRAAMSRLWRQLKQVIEPSGAVALAAVESHPEHFRGRRVGVILSGGNLDVDALLAHLPEA